MLGLGLGLTSRGVLQGGSGVAAPWTPLDLGAALKAWWHADDTVNGAVATWTDRVTSLATTAVAGVEPISAATSFNSARGLTFDAVDDCLATTTLTNIPTGAVAGEIWCLVNNTTPGATTGLRLPIRYGTGAATSRGMQRNTAASVNRAVITDGTTVLTDTVIDFLGYHIVGGMFAGTTMEGRIDGRPFTPASTTIATLATGITRLRIGATNGTAGFWWGGGIAQVLITTTLSATQREKLEGWLAWTYALASVLPGDHPYKLVAP